MVHENLGTRNNLFAGMFMVFAIGFLVNDYFDWVDECLMAYSIISIFCLVNLVLFGWWWYLKGRATDVYKWLMVLMAGVLLTNMGNLHSRYYFVCGDMDAYQKLITSFSWRYRMVPTLVALMYMMALIVARLCCGEDKE